MRTARIAFALCLAFAAVPVALGQDKTAPPARVTVCGPWTGLTTASVSQFVDGQLKAVDVTRVDLELPGMTSLVVESSRVTGGDELVGLFTAKDKGVVAAGTLVRKGDKVTLTGDVRLRDEGKDKALPSGTVVVEGEAVGGEHPYGKDGKSPLAIRDGAGVIVVAGKLTKEQAESRGAIRVTGTLAVGPKGAVWVVANAVEVVKKPPTLADDSAALKALAEHGWVSGEVKVKPWHVETEQAVRLVLRFEPDAEAAKKGIATGKVTLGVDPSNEGQAEVIVHPAEGTYTLTETKDGRTLTVTQTGVADMGGLDKKLDKVEFTAAYKLDGGKLSFPRGLTTDHWSRWPASVRRKDAVVFEAK